MNNKNYGVCIFYWLITTCLFTGITIANEPSAAAEDLSEAGIDAAVISHLLKGTGTLTQRADEMLKNGIITRQQYNTINNKLINLPADKRQAIKNAYDKNPSKPHDAIQKITEKKIDINNDASIRDHIKDLKQEGFTKEQILARLKKEGISVRKLKSLGYGQIESKKDNVKDQTQNIQTRQKTKNRRDQKADDRQSSVNSENTRRLQEQDKRPLETKKTQRSRPVRTKTKDSRDSAVNN